MIKEAIYTDPIMWILYGFLFGLLITVAVYILTKEYFYRKGYEEGLRDKKTPDFRRVGKPRGKTSEQPPEDWECQLCGESFLNEPSLHAHMRNQHQVDTKSKQSRKRG